MEKQFDPHHMEQKWYQHWEKQGYFYPSGHGKPFCIMLPPPNVTGSLHMGHSFQQTLMDILIRYHRMCGDNTLWQPGTDHAGIATQMVVERQLLEQGLSRHDIGRTAFVEKIWDWKQQSGGTIGSQMRRLGASAHWENECFTMDEALSAAVTKVFVALYDENLIYRGQRLVNWDPKLLTAISDLEVEQHEEEGYLWHIHYALQNHSDHIIIATTRPETLLGDVAIAVHPEDTRYQHLIGEYAIVPIANRPIPIIADTYVDPLFGTGCVKITPAHDFNDYAIVQRHVLPLLNILNPNATLNENVPGRYRGLDRFKARQQILDELNTEGLLVKTEPHRLNIPRGDRSGEIIEPYLTDQWYVRTEPLAKPALEAVRSGQIQFHPAIWTKTYYQWLEQIEDWCISRQLWWGHRIPAWYDENHQIFVAENEAAVREKYQLDASVRLTQDQDVLDTWFSSALWPFSTLGWPKQTEQLETFYPTSVLISGFDIIFFWIARMIMFGLKFQKAIPFRDVYITGLIRDNDGQKMSKSKGNVIDPIDLIDGISLEKLLEKRTAGLMQPKKAEQIKAATKKQFPDGISSYGTDALRFTFCSLASSNRELRFDMTRLENHRNFCNKLWNAARFVLMNVDTSLVIPPQHEDYSSIDRWILSKLQGTIRLTHQYIADYRFDLLAKHLYEFIWNEYCDWYLELTKPILVGNTPESTKNATRYGLIYVLETLLRLCHPIMPFITEEIWQQIKQPSSTSSIMKQTFPIVDPNSIDLAIEAEVTWLQQMITAIRTIRSEMNISPAKHVNLLLQQGTALDQARCEKYQIFLRSLAKISTIQWLAADEPAPVAATAVVDTLELLIPLAGLIDKTVEITRLNKAIVKLEKESEAIMHKLNNDKFMTRAPAELVAQEQERHQAITHELNILQGKLTDIKAL